LRLALPTGIRHTLIVELLDTFPQLSPDPNQSVMVWLIGLDSKRPFTTQSVGPDAEGQHPHPELTVTTR